MNLTMNIYRLKYRNMKSMERNPKPWNVMWTKLREVYLPFSRPIKKPSLVKLRS